MERSSRARRHQAPESRQHDLLVSTRRLTRRQWLGLAGGGVATAVMNHVTGTSFALVGQTPIVRATGRRVGCSMISAITNRGQLVFRVFHGPCDGAPFVDFMIRLRKPCRRQVYPIVDGHPVHRSRLAKAFVAAHATRIRPIRLPDHCPELNPDELLNHDVKTNAMGKSHPRDRPGMMRAVRSHRYRRQKQPHMIRNLFQEKHVRYAA